MEDTRKKKTTGWSLGVRHTKVKHKRVQVVGQETIQHGTTV